MSNAEYFRAYNARRNGTYYAAAKAEGGERWQRVMDSRTKALAVRRAKVQSSPTAWLAHHLRVTRGRCVRQGVPFDLTPADIALPLTCPITGTVIAYGGEGRRRNDGPSLDRIRPELGYVRGNVRILSLYANRVRQNCTDPAIFFALAADARRLFGD